MSDDAPAPYTQPALFDLPVAVTDEEEAEDLAGEMDDAVPGDTPDSDDYDPAEPDFTGVCRGGPYDGRTVDCRFPGGFLLYDKARSLMWSYSASPERAGEYVNSAEPVVLTGNGALRQAAEGQQLDVIAYDDGAANA